jgi:hypothetical protein
MSRVILTLESIPLAGQQIRTARTGENGQFNFAELPAGAYLLKATRRGFMPVQYGQRRWDAAGPPIVVTGDEVLSVNLTMSRYGAIAGTVRNTNEVGIPDQNVAAYSNTQPPRFIARGKTGSGAGSDACRLPHGYAEDAETQMERLRLIPESTRWLNVSIQALHRFYQRRTDRVVASWMTRQNRELAIADNIAYITSCIETVTADWPAIPKIARCTGASAGGTHRPRDFRRFVHRVRSSTRIRYV